MAASSLRAAALRGAPLATLPLPAAWAPVSQLVGPLTRGAACFSTTGAHASAAAGGGRGGASGPDAFTAALQQKTEEELRELALKQAQPHAADGPEDGPEPGPDEEQLPDAQLPHGKREIGGYKGPEPTRYSRSGASDWEIKGRCTDF